jgi:prepilin-type N-terminal cleavage/methylation domain-containing protein
MRKKREGFTLVELLIVMAVIAALMGALVPVAISAIQHANATRIAENLESLVTQVQQYAYSNHVIPSTTKLATSVSGGNLTDYAVYYGTSPQSITNSINLITSKTYSIPSNATSVYFAVVYNPSFSALAVHNVWSGATNTGVLGLSNAASPCATGVVVKYW